VPAACPIGWSMPGTHGRSRIARYVGSPADGQADPLRKPAFQAGHAGSASWHPSPSVLARIWEDRCPWRNLANSGTTTSTITG
jgi:hypothetical protein